MCSQLYPELELQACFSSSKCSGSCRPAANCCKPVRKDSPLAAVEQHGLDQIMVHEAGWRMLLCRSWHGVLYDQDGVLPDVSAVIPMPAGNLCSTAAVCCRTACMYTAHNPGRIGCIVMWQQNAVCLMQQVLAKQLHALDPPPHLAMVFHSTRYACCTCCWCLHAE